MPVKSGDCPFNHKSCPSTPPSLQPSLHPSNLPSILTSLHLSLIPSIISSSLRSFLLLSIPPSLLRLPTHQSTPPSLRPPLESNQQPHFLPQGRSHTTLGSRLILRRVQPHLMDLPRPAQPVHAPGVSRHPPPTRHHSRGPRPRGLTYVHVGRSQSARGASYG